jgi:mannose-6-phosphate isomerase-like protein (cupin superfamily)
MTYRALCRAYPLAEKGDVIMDGPKTRKKLVEAAPCAAFHLDAIVKTFPEAATTMLLDTRLTDEDEASARVFRVYSPTPAHYHATCDEYLLVLSGRASFFMGDREPFKVGPRELLFFKKSTVHGMPEILEHPLFVFSVDTPRRDPRDIIFLNPADGTPETFIQPQAMTARLATVALYSPDDRELGVLGRLGANAWGDAVSAGPSLAANRSASRGPAHRQSSLTHT